MTTSGPLQGLKVVELAGIGPGPFAAMLLADLGADVVRVDRPGTPAVLPLPPPHLDLLNRGKRSVVADLKDPAGVSTVLALAQRASILIEGWRPGVAERLGVGPEVVLRRNPALVYGRMTGWGQSGPRAHTAGHDIDYLALSGALYPLGRAGGPPQVPLNLLGDFGGGALYLVVGVLAAVLHARLSGRGQVVDAAIVDGAAHLTTMLHSMLAAGLWRDERGSNLLDTGAPFYDVYETADGGYVAVGALEPRFYRILLDRLGIDAVSEQHDEGSWTALRRRLAAAFAADTRDHWAALFADCDGCVAPVLSPLEAHGDPHLGGRATFVDRQGIRQPAPAPRFSATPARLSSPPPTPGQDTDDVLADWGITGGAEPRPGGVSAVRSAFETVLPESRP